MFIYLNSHFPLSWNLHFDIFIALKTINSSRNILRHARARCRKSQSLPLFYVFIALLVKFFQWNQNDLNICLAQALLVDWNQKWRRGETAHWSIRHFQHVRVINVNVICITRCRVVWLMHAICLSLMWSY